MNCKEVRKWMSPYLDSELGSTKTFEVSEHLRDCTECTARFEAERRTDDLIRTRLAADIAMPAQLWRRLSHDLTAPSWVRRLREARNYLAVAACLMLALAASLVYWPQRSSQTQPWIVSRLVAQVPQDGPFPANVDDQTAAERLLRDEYHVRVAMGSTAAQAQKDHDLHLISAVKKTDGAGRAYLEVRLNCCGQPVVMAFARSETGALPVPFDIASGDGPDRPANIDGVQVASVLKDGLVVVAASQHPVRHILNAIERVQA